ncbi:oligosaccharide flippase family protein [Gemmata sp.]|uniref:oligosaccharide flippase family protein n=1 Tax=Gemmata sp. TaxID=1914242 RepID=UPI003F6E5928
MSDSRVIGGTAWTVGGYAAMQVCRFAFNVSLAQMVAPKVFGVMALVSLFLQGLEMFSDLGVRQCVVQHPRGDDPGFLNTAWTVQVLRGTVLWIGTLLLAWPMAAFYGEPALVWLIPVAGLSAFVHGLSSTSLLTYSREVRRGPLVRRELGGYVLTYGGVLVAIALIGERWPGPEGEDLKLAALALGTVGYALCEVALSFTLGALTRHRFAWDLEARRELLNFGGWVFLSSACTFLAAQADRLIVGKLSLELLGVYHIAVVIAALPAGVLAAVGIHLVYPLMADALRDGEPVSRVFRRAHRILVVTAGLLITGVACVGPAFVNLLYDDRYAATAGFVRHIAVAAWFTALLIPGELALLAVGQTRGVAAGQAARLLFVPGMLLGGYWAGGLPGLILGVACCEVVRYAVVALYLKHQGVRVYRSDAAVTLLAGLVLGAYVLVEEAAGPRGRLAVPLVGGALQVVFWAGVYWVWAGPVQLASPLGRITPGTRTTVDGGHSGPTIT